VDVYLILSRISAQCRILPSSGLQALGTRIGVYERCDRETHLLFIPPSYEKTSETKLNATSGRNSSLYFRIVVRDFQTPEILGQRNGSASDPL